MTTDNINLNFNVKQVEYDNCIAITLRRYKTVIGHASLRIENLTCHKKITLESIHIDPNYQRRGFGRLLLGKIEVLAKRNKIFQIEVDSVIQAEGFYQAHGYHKHSNKQAPQGETPFVKHLQ